MRRALASLMLLLLATAAIARAGDEKVLFNGSSTDGWKHVGPGKFVLDGGILRTEGGMGLLWYEPETFGDCVIKVVYKAEHGHDNSGVFIRIADKPDDPWYAVHHGYEVQICDAADEFHRTGAIYSMSKANSVPGKLGEWNTLEITLQGQDVKVAVNGTEVNAFNSNQPVPPRTKEYEPERGPRPARGYIGLQNHGEGEVVLFKEVSVRPL